MYIQFFNIENFSYHYSKLRRIVDIINKYKRMLLNQREIDDALNNLNIINVKYIVEKYLNKKIITTK